MWGFDSMKDVLEVILVPLLGALLIAYWPELAARRRRRHFEKLIGRELAEAAPNGGAIGAPWHQHLTRRFLHEEIIGHPVENADFVLSLSPDLSYNLSQMWIEFAKARRGEEEGAPSQQNAEQFCWYLLQTAKYLDGRGRSLLVERVWEPWKKLVKLEYPDARFGSSTS
jgi:hypothetical protein